MVAISLNHPEKHCEPEVKLPEWESCHKEDCSVVRVSCSMVKERVGSLLF